MDRINRGEKPFGNGPESAPFAILKDFVLGDDSEYGSIWAVDVSLRLIRVCGVMCGSYRCMGL